MKSHREVNSDFIYSEENQEEKEKDDKEKDDKEKDDKKKDDKEKEKDNKEKEENLIRKFLLRHHLSESKLPTFSKRNRKPNPPIIKIDIDIEETKNKIIKNLESIKIFDVNNIKNSRNNLKKYNIENHNSFNIFRYIDERKNIKDKLLLYHSNLESDVLRLIEYLSIDPIKRTKFEHKYIKNYLMKTSLMQSLLNLNENKRNITKILNKICLSLKYKFIYAGKTIYEINSIPLNYYYIIEGKVQALKPEKIVMRMTGFEYFTYIMRLKRDNEKYLIDLILKNQTNFAIYRAHLPILNYIIFTIIYREFCNNINYRFYFKYELEDKNYNETPLDKMINLCFINKEELLKGINQNFIESKSPMKELEKQLQKNMPHIDDELLKYYRPMALDKKLFDITLYKYKSFVDLKKGSFFGESTNNKYSLREYTIKTVEDCHLSYLEIEIYNSFLKIEKEKITTQMVDYLYDKFFFNSISEIEFKNNFFQSFVFEVKELGKKLSEQDKKLDYIYFIKEGEIAINCIHSVNSFITNILNPLKENYFIKYNEEFIELITQLDQFLKGNKFNYNLLSPTSLFIAISRSIIGLDSLIFGFNNYIYDAITNSVVKYFKIEKKYLLRILREYYLIKEVARNEAIQSILLFIDRFIKSLIMQKTKKNHFVLSQNNVKLNLKNIRLIDYENEKNQNLKTQKEDNNLNSNKYYYDEGNSINKKKLNKCIINYNTNIKPEKENDSENLIINQKNNIERKKIKEKTILKDNSRNKLSLHISNSISKYKNLEKINFDVMKYKLKKATIKQETILVNILQKNLAHNLLFSRPKFNKETTKSNNDILQKKTLSLGNKKQIKLKSLNNKNENSIKTLKYNFNSQEESFHNNSEKDNSISNSNAKTYISIKTNIMDCKNINEDINEFSICQSEEEIKIIPKNNIKAIKKNNKLFKNNLSPINKRIMKKNLSNLEKNFLNSDKNISNKYNNLFKSFSSINDMAKKGYKSKKNNKNNQFLLYRTKKDKYKILKEKILKQNFWN